MTTLAELKTEDRQVVDATSDIEIVVVIPARNAALTLDAQLDALAAQDYRGRWSIVIALQPSTDATERIVGDRSDPRITVVHSTRRLGASAARNDGVMATNADYVAFCDADDIVSPHWLSSLASQLPAAVIVGARVPFRGSFDPSRIDISTKYETSTNSGFLTALHSNTCMIKRSVFVDVGGFDEDFAGIEDIEFGFRLQLANHEVASASDAFVFYRARTTARGRWLQRCEWERGRVQLYRRFAASGMPRSDTTEALRHWWWLVAHLPALRRPEVRGRWAHRSAVRCGRVVGSIVHRRLYL